MPRGNVENLKRLSSEEAKKNGSKGGKKSAEVRREQKTFKELAKSHLTDEQKIMLLDRLYDKALEGDVKAFEVLRDTLGEKPKEEVAVTTNTLTVSIEDE